MEDKFLKILDQNICYNYKNVKADKTLLFLHGWGTSKESFAPIMNILDKEDVNMLALDFPGFGKSQEPKSVFGVEDYAQITNVFINKLSIKNVIIIGHSFGARVSFYLCLENSEIKKMVLTGAAGIKPKRKLSYYFSIFGYKVQKFLCKTPFYSQYKEDLLNSSGSDDYKNSSSLMKQVLIKVVNEDLKKLFSKIKIPVVLFWGDQDLATPIEDGEIMHKMIKDSELIKVKGTHYAFLENEEEFCKEIRKLI